MAVSDTLGLVDNAVGLVDSISHLPYGQEKIKLGKSLRKFLLKWFSFECGKVIGFALIGFMIGLKNLGHFFTQSELKLKPIANTLHMSSYVLHQLHVQWFTMIFDWFIGLSGSFVIG